MYVTYCNGIRKICYIKRGNQVPDNWVHQCSETFPKGFMVVGVMTGRGVLPLIKVPSKVKVNSEFYIECVLKPVIEQLKDLYPGEMDKVFLHHDKASSHTSNKTQQFLQEMKDTLGLNFIRNSDIPVKSPDASPLDFYGFGMLKQRLFNRRPKTEAGLWKAAQEEWSNVSLSKVKEVFAAWKVRCREIAKKKGKHIEHMKKIHMIQDYKKSINIVFTRVGNSNLLGFRWGEVSHRTNKIKFGRELQFREFSAAEAPNHLTSRQWRRMADNSYFSPGEECKPPPCQLQLPRTLRRCGGGSHHMNYSRWRRGSCSTSATSSCSRRPRRGRRKPGRNASDGPRWPRPPSSSASSRATSCPRRPTAGHRGPAPQSTVRRSSSVTPPVAPSSSVLGPPLAARPPPQPAIRLPPRCPRTPGIVAPASPHWLDPEISLAEAIGVATAAEVSDIQIVTFSEQGIDHENAKKGLDIRQIIRYRKSFVGTNIRAFAYDGTELPLVGQSSVECKHDGNEGTFEFIIPEAILNKYHRVFQRTGAITEKCELRANPERPPVRVLPRIPSHLSKEVICEMDNMVHQDIITKINH
ncbi:IKK1 [Cordylochernes scorpioides]|uniref:IKK1 n=1 Tax=Cordylochernes scorpioides TaxID=51811 RepID=A0ABY6KVB5_9ARAC|nr:IKK1 [Cordylochernes scorpioides]